MSGDISLPLLLPRESSVAATSSSSSSSAMIIATRGRHHLDDSFFLQRCQDSRERSKKEEGVAGQLVFCRAGLASIQPHSNSTCSRTALRAPLHQCNAASPTIDFPKTNAAREGLSPSLALSRSPSALGRAERGLE